jgi:twitching motility protein PilT
MDTETVSVDQSIVDLLKEMLAQQSSDLHIQTGVPPTIRVRGELIRLNHPSVTQEQAAIFMKAITGKEQRQEFLEVGSVDFAFVIPGTKQRFRVNAFKERGSIALAFRAIGNVPGSFEDLNLPKVMYEIAEEERGLVLLTGATGSGKSTTLAAIIDRINATQACRIITVEDPIEYIHSNKMSIVAQRELGPDARTFDEALRHAMRQDPDVILIGELRDLETIRTAIRAAETGHLVFSTLHTINAAQTVDRMISYYPPDQYDLIRKQMALNLRAVVSQRLLRRKDGSGRIPAVEVMRNTPIFQKMMLQDQTKELQQVIQNGEAGMQTYDQSLVKLVQADMVSQEEAERYAESVSRLRRILSGGFTEADRSGIISF